MRQCDKIDLSWDVMQTLACNFDTTLSEINDCVGKQVYDIVDTCSNKYNFVWKF
jgi:hypothetical protein